jgi:hypothetical protein
MQFGTSKLQFQFEEVQGTLARSLQKNGFAAGSCDSVASKLA